MSLAQFKEQYAASNAQFIPQYSRAVALVDDFDSALGTSTVTDSTTDTPSITLNPDDQADVTGWTNMFVRFTGMQGKTPSFSLSFADWRTNNIPAMPEWEMLWRYTDDVTVPSDGRPRDWTKFANGSGDPSHTFSHSTAFTSDDVEIAVHPRWRYLDTQRAIDHVEASGLAFELDSSVAASGLDKHVHEQLTLGSSPANSASVVPINLYCIGVDDTGVSPSGGEDKLNLCVLPGQHSGEDGGNYFAWELIYFYIDGVGTTADWFRQYCRLYVYDVNPMGRYYGKERWTEETADDEDPNRSWDDTNSDQVNAVKTALTTDLSRMDVMWDCHNAYFLNDGVNGTYGIYETYATEGTWRSRVATLISPETIDDLGTAPVGSAQEYANDIWSAQLSSTLEFPEAGPGYPGMESQYSALSGDYVEAVHEMVDASELTLTAGSATGTGSAASGDASTSGIGSISGVITGTSVVESDDAVTSGAGTLERSGTGIAVSEDTTTSGTGTVGAIVTGSGAATSGDASTDGDGAREITGLGSSVSEDTETSGAGTRAVTSNVVIFMENASTSGVGERTITGSGSAESGDADTNGFDVFTEDFHTLQNFLNENYPIEGALGDKFRHFLILKGYTDNKHNYDLFWYYLEDNGFLNDSLWDKYHAATKDGWLWRQA